MRKVITAFVIFCVTSCSEANIYGDIDLGSNFYYMVEPAFNSIRHLTGSANSYAIRNIEYLGFNEDYILVINEVEGKRHHWIIDKTKKTKDYGYKESEERVLFSNVIGPIDSARFMDFKNKINIQLYSKIYYRKKGNWQ